MVVNQSTEHVSTECVFLASFRPFWTYFGPFPGFSALFKPFGEYFRPFPGFFGPFQPIWSVFWAFFRLFGPISGHFEPILDLFQAFSALFKPFGEYFKPFPCFFGHCQPIWSVFWAFFRLFGPISGHFEPNFSSHWELCPQDGVHRTRIIGLIQGVFRLFGSYFGPFPGLLGPFQPQGARKQWCRYISLFIWLGYTYGKGMKGDVPALSTQNGGSSSTLTTYLIVTKICRSSPFLICWVPFVLPGVTEF